MTLTANQKLLMGVAIGVSACLLYNKFKPKPKTVSLTLPTLKTGFSGASGIGNGLGELETTINDQVSDGLAYDYDADFDFDGPEDFASVDGDSVIDDFYNAKGGGNKRKLAHWKRRVKILTKKINLAKKGLIKAPGKVDKWTTKLNEANQKVAELSGSGK